MRDIDAEIRAINRMLSTYIGLAEVKLINSNKFTPQRTLQKDIERMESAKKFLRDYGRIVKLVDREVQNV